MRNPFRKLKISWKAVGAAVVSAVGVASHPAVIVLLPPKAAAVVRAVGVAVQAVAGVDTSGVQPATSAAITAAGLVLQALTGKAAARRAA